MPEPEKTPMRWPRARGRMVSKTARPVASRGPSPLRVAGGGGARRSVALAAPGASGRPSSGLAEGVDDAPDPGFGRVDAGGAEEHHLVADGGAVERRVGHGAGLALGDADDLAAERAPRRRPAAEPDRHLVADPGVVREPGDLERRGPDRGHPPHAPAVRDAGQLGAEGGEVGKHRQGLTKPGTGGYALSTIEG